MKLRLLKDVTVGFCGKRTGNRSRRRPGFYEVPSTAEGNERGKMESYPKGFEETEVLPF